MMREGFDGRRLISAPEDLPTVHGGKQWQTPDPADPVGPWVPADVNDPWYPPSPETRQALETALRKANHTPSLDGGPIREALVEHLGLEERRVVVGAGSSPILDHLLRSALGEGKTLLLPSPTYSEYERVGRLADASVYRWLLEEERDFEIVPDELATAAREIRADVVALANPNNPTGHVLRREELLDLLDALPAGCLLLVDEAYVDQCPAASALGEVEMRRRLAVVRSFSKGAALGGVRLGYGLLGDAWRRSALPWQAPPWPVSLLAQSAVTPALRSQEFVRRKVEETRAERDRLIAELQSLPEISISPTQTHYFLVSLGSSWPPSARVVQGLEEKGILVRDCAFYGPPLDPRHLRVATRSPEENRRIADGFRFLAKEILR